MPLHFMSYENETIHAFWREQDGIPQTEDDVNLYPMNDNENNTNCDIENPTPSQRPAPETNAREVFPDRPDGQLIGFIRSSFARTLEHQRDEAVEALKKVEWQRPTQGHLRECPSCHKTIYLNDPKTHNDGCVLFAALARIQAIGTKGEE